MEGGEVGGGKEEREAKGEVGGGGRRGRQRGR